MDVMEQLREQLQGTATSFYGGLIVKSVELADFKNWLQFFLPKNFVVF